MKWYNIVAHFGDYLQLYAGIIAWIILITFVKVRWQCGLCGKINETGVIKHLLCMCDHQGLM